MNTRGGLRPPRSPLPRAASALAVPLLALLAACGSSSGTNTTSTSATGSTSGSSSPAAAAFPVTVTAANGSVTIKGQPHKIVSLSAAETEILFAIGAGPQVVAVDDQSNYPPGVPTTKLSGYTPNAEAIAGYSPDLVVLSDNENGVVNALGKLKIPTLLLPAPKSLDDSYGEYLTLGKATGHEDDAAKEVQKVKDRIGIPTLPLLLLLRGRPAPPPPGR